MALIWTAGTAGSQAISSGMAAAIIGGALALAAAWEYFFPGAQPPADLSLGVDPCVAGG